MNKKGIILSAIGLGSYGILALVDRFIFRFPDWLFAILGVAAAVVLIIGVSKIKPNSKE